MMDQYSAHSIGLIPSWQDESRLVGQEIRCLLQNPKVEPKVLTMVHNTRNTGFLGVVHRPVS
jgi:hypothetical protein